jgi:hypothetical protein
MSSSLANTVTLLNDNGLRQRVKAALMEAALTVAAETPGTPAVRIPRVNLALNVIADADARLTTFLMLVTDDAVVSANTDPAAVQDADIRRVIAFHWGNVAAAIPNLGS